MKKSKILIALALVVSILVSAGAGAGTYAYFSKDLGSMENTINVANFNPDFNMDSKKFVLDNFAPDKDVRYMTYFDANNTTLDTIYKSTFKVGYKGTYTPPISDAGRDYVANPKKLFENEKLDYRISLNNSSSKYVKLKKSNGSDDWTASYMNGSSNYNFSEPIKDSSHFGSDNEYRTYLVHFYTKEGFPYVTTNLVDTGLAITTETYFDYDEDNTDQEPINVNYRIKWIYETSPDNDNKFINSQDNLVTISAEAVQALNIYGSPDATTTYTTTSTSTTNGVNSYKMVHLSYNVHEDLKTEERVAYIQTEDGMNGDNINFGARYKISDTASETNKTVKLLSLDNKLVTIEREDGETISFKIESTTLNTYLNTLK